MTRNAAPASAVELAAALFQGTGAGAFAPELTAWLAGSPRFRSFVERNRAKIRKKLRGAAAGTDAGSLRDVRTELEVARLLLTERRIELVFEASGSGKVGPDLTLTVNGVHAFHVEVTRLRRLPPTPIEQAAPVLAKLRQLPPSVANAVLLAVPGTDPSALDVAAAMHAVHGLADTRSEAFFRGTGFATTRAFYDRFLRLGGVYVLAEPGTGDPRATLWVNRSARIALPERAARVALAALQTRD